MTGWHIPLRLPCRLWSGSPHNRGYGRMWFEGKQELTHRLAFFFENDRWPRNHALHRCGRKMCCEPTHIYDGTDADNMRDQVRLGEHGMARKSCCPQCGGEYTTTAEGARRCMPCQSKYKADYYQKNRQRILANSQKRRNAKKELLGKEVCMT